MGYTFLISAAQKKKEKKKDGYWLEPPRRGGSNEYPQTVMLRNMKIRIFYLNFQFLVVKFNE